MIVASCFHFDVVLLMDSRCWLVPRYLGVKLGVLVLLLLMMLAMLMVLLVLVYLLLLWGEL